MKIELEESSVHQGQYTTILKNPDKHFLITEIGCGLAQYKQEDIAPLFIRVLGLTNISLPQKFLDIIDI